MKIGYFTTLFPYQECFEDSDFYRRYPVGGAEIAAYNIAINMANFGHQVFVFTTSINSTDEVQKNDNITIFRYGTNIKLQKAFFSFNLFNKPLNYDMDIVHLHFTTPPGNLAAFHYSRSKHIPLLVHYHGDSNPGYGSLIRRLGLGLSDMFLVDRLLSAASQIVPPSEQYVSESKFLSRHKENIFAIPYGINPEEIQVEYNRNECRKKLLLSQNGKIILFVGALINYKGPDLLIKALPQIIKEIPETFLVFIGDGPLRYDLEALAHKLNVSNRIRFTGPLVGKEKALYYNAANVFALPSTLSTESFGIVLLEASSAGLPIVVSSLNTFRAFIEDGFNGIVTQTGNVDSLTQSIINILSNSDLCEKLQKNSRNKIKDYSWHNIARKFEDVYTMVMNTEGIKIKE